MKTEEEIIKQVLAFFDEEDIPYINFEYLYKNNVIKSENYKPNVKVKKLGGKNDRPRK